MRLTTPLVLIATCIAMCVFTAPVLASGACPNETIREEQDSTGLPDCRAWEQVSPVDKNGGDVMAVSPFTRAAADGNAVQYSSLSGFGEVLGSGVSFAYLAERGPGGWLTHGISPRSPSNSIPGLSETQGDAQYVGDFSADLNSGVYSAGKSITEDPNTAEAGNLYLRNNLRIPGAGSYEELTLCEMCGEAGPLLPARGSFAAGLLQPYLAGTSPDMGHVVFQSRRNLTKGAPEQSPLCGAGDPAVGPPPWALFCQPRVYEWDHGVVRLAGILPDGTPAPVSIAGLGTGETNFSLTPHIVSDGSDGHSRIFFTVPTVENTSALVGNLYMRVDHTQTVQLNASERTTTPSEPAPAEYLDASKDGERIFFSSRQALTNDAVEGGTNIYMYDASKPDSAPDNLTLLTTDQMGGAGKGIGLVGASDDGHYVYVMVGGLSIGTGIYLWHDGEVKFVGPASANELVTDGVPYYYFTRQGWVTPDGHHLLFDLTGTALAAIYGTTPTCKDEGAPGRELGGSSCRELYVYSADTGAVSCVSCDPSGLIPTHSGSDLSLVGSAGTVLTTHQNRAMSDDGSLVFFSTGEALLPQDTNGKIDVYEYDTTTNTAALISSGKSTSDSYFLEASPNGHDVFFTTREQLVGWDNDQAYDLYDARIDGGYAEPPAAALACSGEACHGTAPGAPRFDSPASASFSGSGNSAPETKAPVASTRPKTVTNKQKLARALKACHKLRPGHRRRACESQARKRHGQRIGSASGRTVSRSHREVGR